MVNQAQIRYQVQKIHPCLIVISASFFSLQTGFLCFSAIHGRWKTLIVQFPKVNTGYRRFILSKFQLLGNYLRPIWSQSSSPAQLSVVQRGDDPNCTNGCEPTAVPPFKGSEEQSSGKGDQVDNLANTQFCHINFRNHLELEKCEKV